MLQGQLLEAAGLVNAAADVPGAGGFVNVTLEEIIGWDPEVIYLPVYAVYTVESLLADPAWAGVSAVKNRRVYRFPSPLEPWDYPTPACALGLSWLIHNVNPGLYPLEAVLDDANAYYQLVYGKTFTAEQIGIAE